MNKNKRILAAALCAVMVIVLLSSAFGIAQTSGHNCSGIGCRICASIQSWTQNLSLLAWTGAVSAIALKLVCLCPAATFAAGTLQLSSTLVTLRVKLSN